MTVYFAWMMAVCDSFLFGRLLACPLFDYDFGHIQSLFTISSSLRIDGSVCPFIIFWLGYDSRISVYFARIIKSLLCGEVCLPVPK